MMQWSESSTDRCEPTRCYRRLTRRWLLLLGLALSATGCAPSARDISGEYGRRVGRTGAASVNGTSVFARMFREGGARVKTATR